MSQQATGTKLIIQHDLTASWVMCNNRFTKKLNETAKRSGVLFQLGDFKGNEPPPYVFDKVTLELQGGETKTFGKDVFFWINIVSTFDGGEDPMLPEHAFSLYPNSKEGLEDPCAGLAVPDDMKKCLRNRKLHWDQETVVGIITYWAGMKGFRMVAEQIVKHRPGSRLEFSFEDGCRVAAYREVDRAGGRQMELVKAYAENQVVSVTVCAREGGPTDGAQQDPPWPPPNP